MHIEIIHFELVIYFKMLKQFVNWKLSPHLPFYHCYFCSTRAGANQPVHSFCGGKV